MAVDRASIAGVVLAGGRSRRMGGGDKGLLVLSGTPMLGHVIARLKPQVAALAINANGDPARFAAFGLPVIPDLIAGHAGPLAGVHAAMRWAGRDVPGARWIATASGDVPLLPEDLVGHFVQAIAAAGSETIVVARSGGRTHPVIGLWPIRLADRLEDALRTGEFKVGHWARSHGAIEVDFPMLRSTGGAVDPFFNVNTPEELDEIRRILMRAARP
jgi:molybdopterin-guanine dinucleotide biosynthesis protein A